MTKQTFLVNLDDEFWTQREDANGPYEEVTDFAELDALANGFLWSVSVKGAKQRKFHALSGMTRSIYAMLDTVQHYLQEPGMQIMCMTPDVEVIFSKA